MLNAALTTIKGVSEKHLNIWKPYTEKILTDIATKFAENKRPLVFIMWGNFAIGYTKILDKVNFTTINNGQTTIHRFLTWGHPSPLSPHNKGDPVVIRKHFANCENFKQCNNILKEFELDPIEWGKLDAVAPENKVEEIAAAPAVNAPINIQINDEMMQAMQRLLTSADSITSSTTN